MATDNNNRIKEKDNTVIYQVQGPKSFLKVKMDWANIDKIHLSFVSHTGRANGCAQVSHIEGALRINGSDGALYFCEAILSGSMATRRQRAIKEAQESNSKYPQPIFTYNGGSDAKGERPVMWRQISLAPGAKTDYVLQVTEAEGVKNDLGGFQKKQGAKSTFISVGCSRQELVAMASAIKLHWAAYIANPTGYMAIHGREANGMPFPMEPAPKPAVTSALPTAPQPAQQTPAPAPVSTPVQSTLPDMAYAVYDSMGEGMEIAITSDKALETLQRKIKDAKASGGWVRRDNTKYESAKANILSGANGIFPVELCKGDESMQIFVVTCRVVK